MYGEAEGLLVPLPPSSSPPSRPLAAVEQGLSSYLCVAIVLSASASAPHPSSSSSPHAARSRSSSHADGAEAAWWRGVRVGAPTMHAAAAAAAPHADTTAAVGRGGLTPMPGQAAATPLASPCSRPTSLLVLVLVLPWQPTASASPPTPPPPCRCCSACLKRGAVRAAGSVRGRHGVDAAAGEARASRACPRLRCVPRPSSLRAWPGWAWLIAWVEVMAVPGPKGLLRREGG